MKWPFVRRSKYARLFECLDKKNYQIFNQYDEINKLYQCIEETKEKHKKLDEAYHNLEQENIGLLFQIEQQKERNNKLLLDKQHLKNKISKIESELSKLKSEHESVLSQNKWFYGSFSRFKDQIEKSGYYKK